MSAAASPDQARAVRAAPQPSTRRRPPLAPRQRRPTPGEAGAVAPVLDRADEQALAQRIARGQAAAAQLRERPDADAALQAQIADGEQARTQLIEAHLRLVAAVARKYAGRGLDLANLVQEGTIGLMRAVQTFDVRAGHRFATYATWWVRQAITRALADQGRLIRLPVHVVDTLSAIRTASIRLQEALGHAPTLEEIAGATGRSVRQVQRALEAASDLCSLDRPLDDQAEDRSTLGALVADDRAVTPEAAAEQGVLRAALAAALAGLPTRERRVLALRYGLGDGQPRTLEEVGRICGVSREVVRRIEMRALRRLRHPHLGRGLRAFLEG
ncbi:MAG TPA: sigma-70 family RNA polymerase sigma factor [Roseiflexaceae bacterium]|nr:sigma-70 family RNA polymerase sigma factor [Roseiflexaceae bacterium]